MSKNINMRYGKKQIKFDFFLQNKIYNIRERKSKKMNSVIYQLTYYVKFISIHIFFYVKLRLHIGALRRIFKTDSFYTPIPSFCNSVSFKNVKIFHVKMT